MLVKTITLICFSLCSVTGLMIREDENPGAACRISVKAFNVISEALLKTLKHETQVNPYLIPDQYSDDDNGTYKYSITEIFVDDFKVPLSKFTFLPPDGITWSLKNMGFSLSFNWSYEEWFLFTTLEDTGLANFSVSGLSVDIQVSPRRNDNDQLILMLTSCWATVDKVSLDIDRAIYRFLLKLGLVQTMLERRTTSMVCDLVRMAIEELNNNPMPSRYPVFSAAGYGRTDLIFDYGLIRDPIIGKGHMVVNHWGRFMLDSEWENFIIPAPEMTIPKSKYMFTSAVTNLPFNTLADAVMRSKYSSLYLTRLDFSTVSDSPLETTCANESICFGKFVPEIAKMYPNKSVTMLIILTTRPDLTINKDSFTITAGHRIEFNITEKNGKDTPVLSLQLSITVTGTAHIADSTLYGKLISLKLVFSAASSPFIKNTAEFLKRLNKKTVDDMAKFIKRFNEALAPGSQFPTKYPFIFLQAVNPQLTFIPGNIIFNVDFDIYDHL